jgi:hypothetical protein
MSDDLREMLESAVEEVESGGGEDTTSASEPEPEIEASSDGEPPTETTEHVTPEDGTPPDAPQAGETATETPTEREIKTEKAPVGWSPTSREQWATLPPELKTQISKREQEVNNVLQNTSEARKFHGGFTKAMEPYQQLMQSEGVNDPMQAVTGLMNTAQVLSTGNPQQKAAKLAQMVSHYGIDIGALDDVLTAQMNGQEAPQHQNAPIDDALAQRLAPMEQMFNKFQQQQNAQQDQQRASIQSEVSQFEAKSEFIGDVRQDMADVMEMASNRGQVISLQQAYDKACAMNPEIGKVIAQRQQQKDLGLKARASVGVHGTLGGDIAANEMGSLRDELERNWGA